MMGCGSSVTDMAWMQRLVQEALAAQKRLLDLIEANEIDWQTDQHNKIMDDEDAEQEEEEDEESSGAEDEEEDDAGVRVGRFGKMEVVADEDMEAEEGAEAFDPDEYRRAMATLRQGRMAPGDLKGVQFDRQL
jgi:hypothetical protein